jgi:PIN domain nuclease of toxin-antitoxin system
MIVLDTHALIWWLSDAGHLSTKARRVIEEGAKEKRLLVSSISVWETALLVTKGRLTLSLPFADWLRHAEALPFLTFIPVDNAIAARSVSLPDPLHPDPADRIIVATTLQTSGQLVTRDQKLHDYPHVTTIW